MTRLSYEKYFDVAEYFFKRVSKFMRYNSNNQWVINDEVCDEARVHMLMVKDLSEDLRETAMQYSNRANSVVDFLERDRYIDMSTNLLTIVNKLQDKMYRDKLIQELIIIYKVVE